MRLFRYVVGNATRDKLEDLFWIRAATVQKGQTQVELETGYDSKRVVANQAVPEELIGVQDSAGQMEVIEITPPATPDPVDRLSVRAIHTKILAGQAPSPTEMAIYSASLGQRVLALLPRTADWPKKSSMESLRDKIAEDTATADEKDDAIQALLEIFVGPYVAP